MTESQRALEALQLSDGRALEALQLSDEESQRALEALQLSNKESQKAVETLQLEIYRQVQISTKYSVQD